MDFANPCREAEPQGFLTVEDAPGEDQFSRHVVAHWPAHQHDAGHVGDQAPLDLHDRQLSIGSDETHVGAEADLESAAKGHAVHGRNYRDGYLALDRHRLAEPGWRRRAACGSLARRCTR